MPCNSGFTTSGPQKILTTFASIDVASTAGISTTVYVYYISRVHYYKENNESPVEAEVLNSKFLRTKLESK